MQIQFEDSFVKRFTVFLTVITAAFAIMSAVQNQGMFEITDTEYQINVFTYLYAFFNQIIFMIFFKFFVTPKSKAGNRLRFIILYLIPSFIICYYFQDFISIKICFPGIIMQFLFTSMLHDMYMHHDVFEEKCENLSGTKLASTLMNDRFCATDFYDSVKNIPAILVVVAVIITGLVFTRTYVVKKFSLFSFINTLLYIFSVFMNFSLIALFKQECFYAFLGFESIFNLRHRIFKFSLVFFLVCLLAGLIISPGKAPINLAFLFDNKPIQDVRHEVKKQFNIPDPIDEGKDIKIDMQLGKNYEPNKIVELLLLIFKYSLIAVSSVLILIFLFSPLFSMSKETSEEILSIPKRIKRFLGELRKVLKKFFSFKRQTGYATVNSSDFKIRINEVINKSNKSRRKKKELDRLTKMFVKIIEWGNSKDTKYTQNLAPLEYTTILYEKTGDANLITAGNLFEKALYAEKLLSQSEEMQFNNAVISIINSGR